MYTKCLTQHITIDYEYASTPSSSPNKHTTSLDTALVILPPLIIKKAARTTHIHLNKPFQYDIEFINPCHYPMYIYFFDHLSLNTMYQPHSFIINHRYAMKPTYFNDWVYYGILPPCSKSMISYTAKVVPSLYRSLVASQTEALYYFILPNPLLQPTWFYAESNLWLYDLNKKIIY